MIRIHKLRQVVFSLPDFHLHPNTGEHAQHVLLVLVAFTGLRHDGLWTDLHENYFIIEKCWRAMLWLEWVDLTRVIPQPYRKSTWNNDCVVWASLPKEQLSSCPIPKNLEFLKKIAKNLVWYSYIYKILAGLVKWKRKRGFIPDKSKTKKNF